MIAERKSIYGIWQNPIRLEKLESLAKNGIQNRSQSWRQFNQTKTKAYTGNKGLAAENY